MEESYYRVRAFFKSQDVYLLMQHCMPWQQGARGTVEQGGWCPNHWHARMSLRYPSKQTRAQTLVCKLTGIQTLRQHGQNASTKFFGSGRKVLWPIMYEYQNILLKSSQIPVSSAAAASRQSVRHIMHTVLVNDKIAFTLRHRRTRVHFRDEGFPRVL